MLFKFRNKKLMVAKKDEGISCYYVQYNTMTIIKNFLLRMKDIMFVIVAVAIICNLPLMCNNKII